MAFSRPSGKGAHPAPWKPAKGGLGIDIDVEIKAPAASCEDYDTDAMSKIWWIAALLRLGNAPYLTVPVISNQPFDLIPHQQEEPTLTPFEIEPRMFSAPENKPGCLSSDSLEWVKEKWVLGLELLNANQKFQTSIRAFDSATIHGKPSSSLLGLWGALEQLFAPSPGELRFRTAALLASYLESPGQKRHDLYKKIRKLYDERSTAAHLTKNVEYGPVVETYVLLRNALVKMIDQNEIPSQEILEGLLFDSINTR